VEMKKESGLLILLVLISISAYAQTPASREWSYHFGYLGNHAVRPGGNFGLEYGLADKVKFKSKVKPGKGAINTVTAHQLILGLNAGAIWHPQTSTSLVNSLTLEYRKTTKRRMQIQAGIGGSYLRSFYINSYEVDQSGQVTKRFLGSSGYFGPTLFIGYGRYRKDSRSLQWWHIRLNASYFVGYNATILPYLTTELRLGFHKKSIT
jgi:hypothetical protein